MRFRTVEIPDWTGVEEYVESFRDELDRIHRGVGQGVRLLFRGQRDASWDIETTLYREMGTDYPMRHFDRVLQRIAPAVESVTDRRWKLDSSPFEGVEDIHRPFIVPNYEFMAYARHHGFPTPLLDWSKSLYVALFFAFQNADENCSASVFACLDEFRVGSAGYVGSHRVLSQGEYISPHRRHFNQQSVYTTSMKMVDGTWVYASHQQYFESQGNQPLIAKLAIPGGQKERFMRKLDSMNINAFTLFGSEDGLMETLWLRETEGIERWDEPTRLTPLRESEGNEPEQ